MHRKRSDAVRGTPLLQESIQLLEEDKNLDVDGQHKGAVLFSGTKVLQAGMGSAGHINRQFRLLIGVLVWFSAMDSGQRRDSWCGAQRGCQ